jgi:glucosamine--fructose-6-phosphate aminotransferase (isomerizing)
MTHTAAPSAMARETAEAPAAVALMLQQNGSLFAEIVAALRNRSPTHIITSARGSSDHAAAYLKYLAEIRLGLPCCSLGASVVSIYRADLHLKDAVLITISQSGQSPDILSLQAHARRAGVLSIAVTNQENSPLAREADICLPLHAGPEKSPAATKTFVSSVAVAAQLIGSWAGDSAMQEAVEKLPQCLEKALHADWQDGLEMLASADSLYVIGRGPSFAIAQEAALKLKETSALHAEAFSAAEVMHGPLELVGQNFPALVFCPADDARQTTLQTIARMRSAGARIIAAAQEPVGDVALPYIATGHPLLDPISIIQSFYIMAEALALRRGRNPDNPRLLSKETATL